MYGIEIECCALKTSIQYGGSKIEKEKGMKTTQQASDDVKGKIKILGLARVFFFCFFCYCDALSKNDVQVSFTIIDVVQARHMIVWP